MKPHKFFPLAMLLFCSIHTYAQVGIGTIDPDPSAVLDITSTTQGMLTPRMTTAQRVAITTTVTSEGLLVFDTDEDVFYYFDGSAWERLEGAEKRNNYKLVKDITDLSDELITGGGLEYILDENYMYEINGTIVVDHPIDLNGAYIRGHDTGEDILFNDSGGALFTGDKGGRLKDLLILGNDLPVFNIIGSTGDENLIVYSVVMVGASSVGTLSTLNTVYFEVFQAVSTDDGLDVTTVKNFYIDKIFWTDACEGTFLKLSGTFNNLQLANGRVVTDVGEIGIDVSANPTITIAASIAQVSFTGDGTRVNGYSPSPYPGYFFTNNWDVDSPGLLLETDNAAIGDINLDTAIGSGYETDFATIGSGVKTKLEGTSTSDYLFRFSAPVDNRIVYEGIKTRSFQIAGSISFQGDNNNSIYIFYIAKNGVVLENSKVYREIGGNNDVGAAAIVASVEMAQGDYVEVWAEKYDGAGSLLVVSLNLIAQ